MKTQNNTRTLIISPDQKYWDLSKPLLFCGEWCINKNNEELLKEKNYKILNDKVFQKNFNLSQISFCDQVYENLLKEISIVLNKFHGINWSFKAWRIVIGPWLNRYIAIINNRLNLLTASHKDYEISFKDIDFNNNSLISFDIRDFTDKAVNHEWNEKLLRRLNTIYLSNNFNKGYLNDIKFEKFNKTIDNKHSIFKDFIKCKLNSFWNFFPLTRFNDFFFHKIYIGSFFTSFKLFVGLKNFPVKYFISEKRFKANFEIEIRKKLSINYDVNSFNEKVIRFLLVETLPTIYLEGFKDVLKSIKKMNLPTSPRKIFTSNCSQDSIFKFWLAEAVNKGSKLIHGQHGAAYGMIIEHSNLKHELSICDKYISWGWNSKNKNGDRILKGVALPIIKEKIKKRKLNDQILIIPTVIDYYLFKNELRRVDKVNEDLLIVNELMNNLDKKLLKNLAFKPHPIETRKKKEFSYYNHFQKNYPDVKLINHKVSLNKLMNNCKLSIFLYLATPFLENLALNKPSLMIYHYGFEETLNKEAFNQFETLVEAGIIFKNPKEAAKFLNTKDKDELEKWWNCRETQEARKKFVSLYVTKQDNSLETLVKCLSIA